MGNINITVILIVFGLIIATFCMGSFLAHLLNKGKKTNNKSLSIQINEREAEYDACLKNNIVLTNKITVLNEANFNETLKHEDVSEESKNENLIEKENKSSLEISKDVTPETSDSSTPINSIIIEDQNKIDDLTIIEGIGPKIEELLHNAGFLTYSKLANCSVENLKEILENAGPRYQMHNPVYWPQQANLANNGQWTALKDLQTEIIGGKIG